MITKILFIWFFWLWKNERVCYTDCSCLALWGNPEKIAGKTGRYAGKQSKRGG